MRILGIDPGSQITGYGVIESIGNRLKLIDSGPIRLKAKGDIQNRLLFLYDSLDALIKIHEPTSISLEKVFHGVNFNSTLILGYVRGVVLTLTAKHDLQLAEYAPTEVKKTVTGYGRAEKSQMQEMVRLLMGLEKPPKPHDVADAIANAICHAHHAGAQNRYHFQ